MSDDGLVFVRVARQILEGNGPVYNVLERSEPTTSVAWTWLLALVGAITPGDLAAWAVFVGGALSVGGLAIALAATRRWYRARGQTAPLVPLTALVIVGAFSFWDFATSGLETGVTTCWLATIWWLLITLERTSSRRRQYVAAIGFGLGVLVRPELAIVTIGWLVAGWLLVRPARRRALALAAAALALPLAYELFRAGYYGHLVPLPAIAKSADSAEWARGWRYAARFLIDDRVGLPLAVGAVLLGIAIARRALDTRDRIVVATPLVCGIVLVIYVVRVGGDFMHARLMLHPTFLLLLPGLVVPFSRATATFIIVVAAWAIVTATTVHTRSGTGWYGDWDERANYIKQSRVAHPTRSEDFLPGNAAWLRWQQVQQMRVGPTLIWDVDGAAMPVDPSIPTPVVIAPGWLGSAGVIAPLDGVVADLHGLANPLGAHITPTQPGRTGHEKNLPWAWIVADYADPRFDTQVPFTPPPTLGEIRAARHALTCGAIKELLDAGREPLTMSRFWSNLTGAVSRTRLVIPADPIEAERSFCR